MGETSFLMDLVAGTIGGVAGIVVGQPADTVKVRTQAAVSGSPTSVASQLIRREGVRGLFKGIAAPIAANAPINATIFVVYGDLIRYFASRKRDLISEKLDAQQQVIDAKIANTARVCGNHPQGSSAAYKACSERLLMYQQSSLHLEEIRLRNKTIDRNQPLELAPVYHFYAGAVAGLTQCVFACPNELVKIKQQMNSNGSKSPGAWSTIKQLIRQGGLRGLFQGLWLTCARDVPAFGLYFASYEIFKSSLSARGWDIGSSSFVAGAGAGISSFAFLHPLDVLKSKRQMQSYDTPGRQTSAWAIARAGYQAQGYRFFLRGITPSVLRAGPVSAVIFMVYEQVMLLMRDSGAPTFYQEKKQSETIAISSSQQ